MIFSGVNYPVTQDSETASKPTCFFINAGLSLKQIVNADLHFTNLRQAAEIGEAERIAIQQESDERWDHIEYAHDEDDRMIKERASCGRKMRKGKNRKIYNGKTIQVLLKRK